MARQRRGEWWSAEVEAPTEERPHRKIYGVGSTEEEALLALGDKPRSSSGALVSRERPEPCDVVRDRTCKAPPGWEGRTRRRCFRCGNSACEACSVLIDYRHFGRVRIGLDCLDEMARFGELDYLTLAVVEGS
jgi:hypothetical protein